MPRVRIQNGKKTYITDDGTEVEVSAHSLLGPNPLGNDKDESRVGPRQQPIKFWKDGKLIDWRTAKEQPKTGYGNPVDDPEYLKKYWGHPE